MYHTFLLPYFVLAFGKFRIHRVLIIILGDNEKEDNFH